MNSILKRIVLIPTKETYLYNMLPSYTVCYYDNAHNRREFCTYAIDCFDARAQAIECIEVVQENPNRIIYIHKELTPHNF